MGRRYTPPEGWDFQGFTFDLKPTAEQERLLDRFFGARRFSHNWTVELLRGGVVAFLMTGMSTEAPSLYGMRKRWNAEKHALAVDEDTGEPWWDEISKEVFVDGIKGAVDGYWRWVRTRNEENPRKRAGFPKRHKKNKRRDSFTIPRSGPDQQLCRRGAVYVPRIGWIATRESTRKLARLIEQGRGEALAVTVSRRGKRLTASVRACVQRPQRNHAPAQPQSRVGVDVGERVLAVVAAPDGTILERVENPKPLAEVLRKVKLLNRRLARQKKGSNRWKRTKEELSETYALTARVRRDTAHKLTSRLAKTHGVVVMEDLNVAGMRKGGAKHLRDAPLGEIRRQMEYKTGWYNSNLILADRFFPSSKLCSACGAKNSIGRKQKWECETCGAAHDRDDNAAVNLARYGLEQNPRGRVDPVQAPAVRSRRDSHAARSIVNLAETRVDAAPPCEAKTAHAA